MKADIQEGVTVEFTRYAESGTRTAFGIVVKAASKELHLAASYQEGDDVGPIEVDIEENGIVQRVHVGIVKVAPADIVVVDHIQKPLGPDEVRRMQHKLGLLPS